MPSIPASAPARRPASAPGPRGARLRRRIAVILLLALGLSAGIYALLRVRSAPHRVARLQEEARLHLRLGQPADAAAKLEQAVALVPDSPALVLELSIAHDAAGQPQQAERALRQGLALMPGHPTLAVPLAGRLIAGGRALEAHALLEPALDRLRRLPDPAERSRALVVAGRAASLAGAGTTALELFAEAARDDVPREARAVALAASGEVLAERGRTAEAERALREARRLDPTSVLVLRPLVALLERDGRRDEAIREVEAVVLGSRDRGLDAVPVLCDLFIRAGRLADAGALAARCDGDAPGRAVAAYVNGAVALADGDAARAEAEFGRMAELMPRAPEPRLLIAGIALAAGATARARTAFEAALAIDPSSLPAELGLLALDERAGAADAVRARAERLIERPAARAVALRALLSTHAREDDARGAVARLGELAKRFPEDRQVRAYEAVFRVLAGDVEAGLDALARFAEEEPDLPGAFALLASVEEACSDAHESIERLAVIAARSPRFARARLVLARMYERLGRRDLAASELEAALASQPDLVEARVALGRLFVRDGDLARATIELERARVARPRDARVLVLLGDVKLATGDAVYAIALFEHAASLEPADASHRARLGRAHAAAGHAREAAAAYEAARRLDPRLPQAHDDAALVLARGEAAAAARALSQALEQTGEARFAAGLAVAAALAGEPRRAPEPFRAWLDRTRTTAEGPGGLVHAALLALAGEAAEAGRAAAAVRAPGAVRAAATGLQGVRLAGDAGADRSALELFALATLGWKAEARARVERIAGDRQASAFAVWLGSQAAARDGGLDPAVRVALARRLVALVPDDAVAGVELADALGAAGDPAAEVATLRALGRRFPEDALVALKLGVALERDGDLAGALEEYARAASAPRPSAMALNNCAYLLASDPARLPVAIAHAQRAAAIVPASGPVLDTLGWLLYQDGQVEAAVRALARAARLAPALASVRFHLAVALDASGEPVRAAHHLRIALLGRGSLRPGSGQAFPEAADARALLAQIEAERQLAAGGAGAAPAGTIAPGPPVAGETGETGVAVLRIAPGGPATARLRFEARSDAPVALTLWRGDRPVKRLLAAPGAEVVVPRLALAPEGHAVLIRTAAPARGRAAFAVALEPVATGDEGFEAEPDDEAHDARTLGVPAALAGALDGPGDRDCVRLDLASARAASLVVAAGPRADLRIEIASVAGPFARTLKVARVRAGEEATIEGLAAPATGGPLVVRVSPGSALEKAATTSTADYRLSLVAAKEAPAVDREPNDRVDAAAAIGAGTGPAAGGVGPVDPVDWYRVRTTASGPLALRVREIQEESDHPRPDPAPEGEGRNVGIGLELWERTPAALRPLGRFTAAGGEIAIPRVRAPLGGELLVAVTAPAGGRAARYLLIVEQAPVEGEDDAFGRAAPPAPSGARAAARETERLAAAAAGVRLGGER